MSKDLVLKDKAEVGIPAGQQLSDWGAPAISANDIIIPRIMLMQPMSEKVTAGEAAFGDFRSSLDNSKLGDFKQGFEFVPICMDKVWIEYDVTQGDDFKNKKFLRATKITAENEGLPYKDQEGPIKISRDKCMNFYVLLVEELRLGGAIPHVLTFRRSGIDAGKTLITQMMVKNSSAGKPPPAVTCLCTASKSTMDSSTWATPAVTPIRATPPEQIVEAFKWYQMIQKGKTKVDESSYADEDIKSSGASVDKGPSQF